MDNRLDEVPERKVFKIETGKLPREQAEEYVQKLMKDYREGKIQPMDNDEWVELHNYESMAILIPWYKRYWRKFFSIFKGWYT